MKKFFASLMMAGMLFAAPAFAQELSPSGDGCWTPVETAAVFKEQAFTLMETLTAEQIATVKENLKGLYPDIPPENFVFTYMELWDNELDDSIWVALYDPNPENADEVCFAGTFAQTQEQIDAVLAE